MTGNRTESDETDDEHPYAAFLDERLEEIAEADFATDEEEATDDACNDDGDKMWIVKTNTSGRQVYGRYSNPEAAVEHARALIDWVDGEYEVDEDPDAHYSEWQAYSDEEDVLVAVDWWKIDDEFRGLTGAGFNAQ